MQSLHRALGAQCHICQHLFKQFSYDSYLIETTNVFVSQNILLMELRHWIDWYSEVHNYNVKNQ